MDAHRPSWLIPSLGLPQIVRWGSMFYAYGILMQPMQTELQLSKPVVVAIAATGAILFFFATAAIRPQSEPISQ